MSQTTAVHVWFKSLYISLTSSAKQQREMAWWTRATVVTLWLCTCHARVILLSRAYSNNFYQKDKSFPQATVFSRNRMQNTFAILGPLFTHTSCCFRSFLDKIFTRKLSICLIRKPIWTLSDTLPVWVLLCVLSHVFAASLQNSYRTIG